MTGREEALKWYIGHATTTTSRLLLESTEHGVLFLALEHLFVRECVT